MASKYRSITFRPTNGGALLSDLNRAEIGLANYETKRDWRRILGDEVRAEGHDYFRPIPEKALGNQPYPSAGSSTEPINLVIEGRRPNGERAVIVATKTKIWRFFALSNARYYDSDYFAETGDDTPYFEDNPGDWVLIGSGFSESGRRWEAVNVAGYLILNNGVDLPVSYYLSDYEVKPIYEMRENGIASVGTIAEHSGILMVGDVRQLPQATVESIMSPVDSGAIEAYQTGATYSGTITMTTSGSTVTASSSIFNPAMVGRYIRTFSGKRREITAYLSGTQVTVGGTAMSITTAEPFYILQSDLTDQIVTTTASFFTSDMVGLKLYWDSGDVRRITGYISATQVYVSGDVPISQGRFKIQNKSAYSAYTDEANIDRYQYRLSWSQTDLPRRWAAIYYGSIPTGSRVLTLKYPVKSMSVGDSIRVLGAAQDGANLTAVVQFIAEDDVTVTLDTPAQTTVTNAQVQESDSLGSIVKFYDLIDDGSGVVRILTLKDYAIVYKETGIYIGSYSGDTTEPFSFRRRYGDDSSRGEGTSRGLFWKNTLVSVVGEYHLYAGRDSFYRFDLTSQVPVEMPQMEPCKGLFFKNVDTGSRTFQDSVFAADNPMTKEVWFCNPNSQTEDRILAFDYFINQCRTSSAKVHSACPVKKPASSIQYDPASIWFILGGDSATVMRYGKLNALDIESGAITATVSGGVVTASSDIFTYDHVGRTVLWSDGQAAFISEYVSPTQVQTTSSPTSPTGTFRIVPFMWNRLGESYDSLMVSGLDSFGTPEQEKTAEGFTLLCGSRFPRILPNIELRTAENESDAPTAGIAETLTDPDYLRIPVYLSSYFIGDTVRVSGSDNPCSVSGRIWSVDRRTIRGFERNA